MKETAKTREERNQLFQDVYNGIVPKRVPIRANLSLEFSLQYAGLPLADTQWTLDGVEEALDQAFQISHSDAYPLGYPRYPAHLHIMGAKTFIMGSNGFMQHPEVKGMEEQDYDDFIKNPYDCLIEKIMPRLYSELGTDPINRSLIIAKGMLANMDYMHKYAMINEKLTEKHGFYSVPRGSGAGVTAPFDYLADFLRSFTGISTDVRRYPEKVAAACEALLPLQVKRGLPPVPSKYGETFIALHMATYLRTKDFEKLFWPSLFQLVHKLAEEGQPCYLFCEDDWTRYLDHLYELPAKTRLYFEKGNPLLIKDKLGKKHIISGLYPLTYLKTATKEQCIDKAKELLDIMAPGGNFVFSFDKSPLSLADVNVENYVAVLKYVAENTKYDNAGEVVIKEENSSRQQIIEKIPEFKSKYYRSTDDYHVNNSEIDAKLKPVIAPILQSYEEILFNFLSRLT